jgi:long-chain acyl-CoA synthetase
MGHLTKIDSTVPHTLGREALQPRGIASYRDLPAFGLLQHAAEQIPDHPAVVYDERTWSFDELNNASIRAAAMLQSLGVKPGNRVGLLLPNVPEFMIAANAIWRVGGIAVAISPLMVAEEVQTLLRETDCHHVVCLDLLSQMVRSEDDFAVTALLVSIREHLPALEQLGYLWARHSRTGHWTLLSTERTRWFWEEVNNTKRGWQPISIDPAHDPAYILPTGGTTGTPKAVLLSHTNMVANAWQQYMWTKESFGTETMMAVLPFFHSYGMSAMIMAGTAMGARLIMHHRFNTRQVIRLMERYKPSVFHAVPTMLSAMNERFETHPAKIEGLRWVISGGAPLSVTVGSKFAEHTGALVVEGYGLSEASPVTHVGPLFEEPHYGTIGFPLPETESRIVDSSDESQCSKPLPDGEVGELVVRGPQIMLGYWKDRATTARAIRCGWLHTGDLAIKEPSGLYRIVGRKKDLIITSGFNVYPSEVEDVIRTMDGVQDAAVVGLPDERRGETVKAFVVLKPGANWNEEAIREHCAKHLAKYKQPRVFERCEGDLPRNFLGKVIRRKLRELPTSAQTNSDLPMESEDER